MIDIFLLAVLAAVGQLGALGSVVARPGAIYFCAVMISCLLATEIYKPRLIWESSQSHE
jgi:paraquat-inducible protein A